MLSHPQGDVRFIFLPAKIMTKGLRADLNVIKSDTVYPDFRKETEVIFSNTHTHTHTHIHNYIQ